MNARITPALCSLLLCASALVVGCGGAAARVASPDDTLDAYVRAVRAGDAEAIYALMDEASRAETDIETLRAQIAEQQQELAEQADAIEAARRGQGDAIEATARQSLRDGERVVLVVEGGRWVILGGVMDAPALRNPRDAVLALRRAIRRRSLGGVLRVLARGPRSDLEATFERFLDDTEDELDLDYEIDGNEAVVRTSTGRVIRLVRESGEWRIVSVE